MAEVAVFEEETLSPDETPGMGEGPDEVSQEKTMILVVEDNRDLRSYICEHLKGIYEIIEAANGEQGVQKTMELIPDLVISDVMMPGMDGVELTRILKKDMKTSHIPVILLTARAAEENKIEGLETGADDYLTKPFNIRELQARIKNMIALRHRMQDQLKKELLVHPSQKSVASMDEVFLKGVIEVIESHISDDHFSVEVLGDEIGMSRSQLHRKLRALISESPNHLIRRVRLERAAQLLRQQGGTISEIAYAVGFTNPAYFTRCFKEQFHVLPSEYAELETNPSD